MRLLLALLAAALVGAGVAIAVDRSVAREGSTTLVVTTAAAGRGAAEPAVFGPATAFSAQRVYAARSAGVVTVYAYRAIPGAAQSELAQGSGFVVSSSGYVLTNAHVITDAGEAIPAAVRPATRVVLEFADGDRVPARVVGWDLFADVGLLRVDPRRHRLSPVRYSEVYAPKASSPMRYAGLPMRCASWVGNPICPLDSMPSTSSVPEGMPPGV